MTNLKGVFPKEGNFSGERGVLKKYKYLVSRLNCPHSLHGHERQTCVFVVLSETNA